MTVTKALFVLCLTGVVCGLAYFTALGLMYR